MPSLTFLDKLISCHEVMHTNFVYLLFSHLKHQPYPGVVKCVVTEAIKIEQEFLTGMLPHNAQHLVLNTMFQMPCQSH